MQLTTSNLMVEPDRGQLRQLYDNVISETDAKRGATAKLRGLPYISLTKGFYAETGDAVFDAAYLALQDRCKHSGTPRLHVVSAPAGGGKTTFSYAFMIALQRYFEEHPEAPYGSVFVVDQIEKAEEVYKELSELSSGNVAIWTSDHDAKRKPANRRKVLNPTATFDKEQLQQKPIAVVTHTFFGGKDRHKAINVRHPHNKRLLDRALVMVDERPEEVMVYQTTVKEAQAVKEKLEEKRGDLTNQLDRLLRFMMPYSFTTSNNAVIKLDEISGQEFLAEQLAWFTTDAAYNVMRDHEDEIVGLRSLFGFANALTQGCTFASRSGAVVYFVGWRPNIHLRHGTVLLDATADIDGLTQLCPWRHHIKVPQARYDRLRIIHVPQHVKSNVSTYLKTADHQRKYVSWMVDTIKQHMPPGEPGLVCCKKTLFAFERVPNWPERDQRFKEPDSYHKEYAWEVDGRKLCAIHYGTGIGTNLYNAAKTVFLFDDFYLSKRVAAANVQGYRGHCANQGDLGSMTTLRKSDAIQIFMDGHRLRWLKQLALRGNGRNYDEHGVCGEQTLVISNDLKDFLQHAPRLFPGAAIEIIEGNKESATKPTLAGKVIRTLSDYQGTELNSRQLSAILKKTWGNISTRVLTPEFHRAIETVGWRYDAGKGKRVSVFRRITRQAATAA